MPKGIVRSVGLGGANERRDVKLIQIYLNSFIKLITPKVLLVDDGLIGTKTINAIKDFQKNSVGMAYPDGRVDPNGKTFRYLTMYFDDIEQNAIEQSLTGDGNRTKWGVLTKEKIRSKVGLDGVLVSYNGVLESRQIVDNYCINVIKLALKEAGMSCAVITSTFRTPEEQAKIMLKNAKKDLKAQYRLYGSNGDKILKLYADNKAKKDSEIVELMAQKINELAKSGKRVSKHCVAKDAYQSLNIIDIGVNSTRTVCKNFNVAKFTSALEGLVQDGYIEKLIDETKKSNSCWHIEIKPNKKTISKYSKGSILYPVKYIA